VRAVVEAGDNSERRTSTWLRHEPVGRELSPRFRSLQRGLRCAWRGPVCLPSALGAVGMNVLASGTAPPLGFTGVNGASSAEVEVLLA
jgi:hypothetical protein